MDNRKRRKRLSLKDATNYVLKRLYNLSGFKGNFREFEFLYENFVEIELTRYTTTNNWGRTSEREKRQAILQVINNLLPTIVNEIREANKPSEIIMTEKYEFYIYHKTRKFIESVNEVIPHIRKFGINKKTGRLTYGVNIPKPNVEENYGNTVDEVSRITSDDIYISSDKETVIIQVIIHFTLWEHSYSYKCLFGVNKGVPFSYRISNDVRFDTLIETIMPKSVKLLMELGVNVITFGDFFFVEAKKPILFEYKKMLEEEGYTLKQRDDGKVEVIWDEDIKLILPNANFRPIMVENVEYKYKVKP